MDFFINGSFCTETRLVCFIIIKMAANKEAPCVSGEIFGSLHDLRFGGRHMTRKHEKTEASIIKGSGDENGPPLAAMFDFVFTR